jgi:oligogalacturonide lyase
MHIQGTKPIVILYAVMALLGWIPTSVWGQPVPQPDSQSVPVTWIDNDTGHIVTRITNEPGSRSLYFNQNAFTPDGKQMVYLVDKSVYVVTLAENNPSRLLVPGPVSSIVVGRKTPTVYFTKTGDSGFYAINVNTAQTLKILDLPPHARITTLNADETLAAGTLIEGEVDASIPQDNDPVLRSTPLTEDQMDSRLAARLPMALFTLDLRTATLKTLLRGTDWLDEVMFSPTDPTLLMYCHQGPWLKVDRLWTIRADGTHNRLVHERTLSREAVGNAFWDGDGKTIWYDLQSPLGQNFYLASYNVATGLRQRYSIVRNRWSNHYTVADGDSAFCGDGSDTSGPAAALDGKWLELFRPRKRTEQTDPSLKNLIQTGNFNQRHLVNLTKQKYTTEPNVRFSPDNEQVIFTSNMFGPSYVFAAAVDVAPTQAQPTTPSSDAATAP